MPPTRITAIHPLRAIEGGRVDVDGAAFPDRRGRSCLEVRIGDLRGARWCFASRPRGSASSCRPGLDGGRAAVRIAPFRRRPAAAFVDIAAPFATGLHQVDNPGLRSRRQPLRHLQRHARPAGAGVDLPRAPERHARNLLVGHREPDVDGDRSVGTALRVEPVRGHGLSRAAGRDDRSRSPTISASPAASRSRPTACSSSATDRGPSSASTPTATRRRSRRCRRASPAFHLAIGPDRALYVTGPTLSSYDPLYRIEPDAHGHDARTPGSGDRRGSRSIRPARSLSSTRSPDRAGCTASGRTANPKLVLAGPGLVGVAFDRRAGRSSSSSNETAYRLPNRRNRVISVSGS